MIWYYTIIAMSWQTRHTITADTTMTLVQPLVLSRPDNTKQFILSFDSSLQNFKRSKAPLFKEHRCTVSNQFWRHYTGLKLSPGSTLFFFLADINKSKHQHTCRQVHCDQKIYTNCLFHNINEKAMDIYLSEQLALVCVIVFLFMSDFLKLLNI